MNSTAATAVLIKQKKYVSAFLAHDCTSIDNARSLEQLGLRESHISNNLESTGVFVRCSGDKYYLDKKMWSRLRNRRMIFIAAAIVVVVVLVLMNVL